MKKLAILTSGGDSSGMNAALRSFVRSALYLDYEVFGIYDGYKGLLEDNFERMTHASVGMCLNYGGTFLRTSRSDKFKTEQGLKEAASILQKRNIDALCVIGGDGSFRGLEKLSSYYSGQLIGIPGTIDNDINGTDYTIGFSTAIEVAVEAIDKIRDTAASHSRLFIVEVMGRHCGQIALDVALAIGAEDVIIEEDNNTMADVVNRLVRARLLGKKFGIVVVAEGNKMGGAAEIAEKITNLTHFDIPIRVSILGHIQRGGSPVAEDRIWAARMGEAALNYIIEKRHLVFTGRVYGSLQPVPLHIATASKKQINLESLELIRKIAIGK